jgi:hypothetical protein
MGKQHTGTPAPEPGRGSAQYAGPERRETDTPYTGPDRRRAHGKAAEPPARRGLLDSSEGGYQLKSRSEGLYPELYQPVDQKFWHGINDNQADALMRLQAIAMEKVGFEKGAPKFFIEDDPGSQYAADDYFVGSERAKVPTPKSVIDLSDSELAYSERRAEKSRWLRDRQDKRKRALQRESEVDGGMNFLAATQAERLAQETMLIATAAQPAVAEFDGPALLIGGMLLGAGLLFGALGLLPVFAAEYADILIKVLPVGGFVCAAFGIAVLFNHMRS